MKKYLLLLLNLVVDTYIGFFFVFFEEQIIFVMSFECYLSVWWTCNLHYCDRGCCAVLPADLRE